MLRIVYIQADTIEELDAVRQALPNLFTDEKSPEEIKKQKRAEYDKKRYQEKKVEKCENDVENCEKSVESTLISQISQEKDEKKSTKRKEEKEIYINITSPNGEVQTDKKPLKPEDDGFWNFAKENSEMAKQFWLETGIFPVKKEFGRWINDLRDLAEAGITIPEMQNAVIYMRSQKLPIGAPGSILKTARWLKTNPQTATRSSPVQAKEESWPERARRIQAEIEGNSSFWNLPEGDVIDI